LNPNFPDGYYSKGFALYKLGLKGEAFQEYDKALEIDRHITVMGWYLMI